MCMHNFIEILQKVQEIGPVLLLSEFGPWQTLVLDLLNINCFWKFHRNTLQEPMLHTKILCLMSELTLHIKICFF